MNCYSWQKEIAIVSNWCEINYSKLSFHFSNTIFAFIHIFYVQCHHHLNFMSINKKFPFPFLSLLPFHILFYCIFFPQLKFSMKNFSFRNIFFIYIFVVNIFHVNFSCWPVRVCMYDTDEEFQNYCNFQFACLKHVWMYILLKDKSLFVWSAVGN